MSYRYSLATGECRLRLYDHDGGYVALLTDISGLSTTNAYEDAASQVFRTFRNLYPMRPEDLLVIAHRLPSPTDPLKFEHFTYHPLVWDERADRFGPASDGWRHPTHQEVVALCGEAIS